jgi:hypothetical protein
MHVDITSYIVLMHTKIFETVKSFFLLWSLVKVTVIVLVMTLYKKNGTAKSVQLLCFVKNGTVTLFSLLGLLKIERYKYKIETVTSFVLIGSKKGNWLSKNVKIIPHFRADSLCAVPALALKIAQ